MPISPNSFITEFNTKAGSDVILYGAGANAIRLLSLLKQSELCNINILCIVDADKDKHGKALFNIPVVAPEKLAEYDRDTCVVITPAAFGVQITEVLNKLGYNNIFYFADKYRDLLAKMEALNNKGDIILYGAGTNATLLLGWLNREETRNINILCIADADKNKQGTELLGIPVVAPEALAKYNRDTCIFVTPSRFGIQITQSLNELGYNNIFYFTNNNVVMAKAKSLNDNAIKNRDEIGRLLQKNEEKIVEVRKSLSDKRSLDVFEAKLTSNFFADHNNIESLYDNNQYFPDDIISLGDNEVFVDCGAFDGGTILDFIRRRRNYRHIYSFEPDPWQYELTKERISFERIARCDIYNLGVYNAEGELNFSQTCDGASRFDDNGDITVRVSSLDALLFAKPNRPTFIKMDIEGSELEALEGCEQIIARDHPKLAISAYHKLTDIYEIPYFFISKFPGYRVYLRQHDNLYETVCYAVWRNSD